MTHNQEQQIRHTTIPYSYQTKKYHSDDVYIQANQTRNIHGDDSLYEKLAKVDRDVCAIGATGKMVDVFTTVGMMSKCPIQQIMYHCDLI